MLKYNRIFFEVTIFQHKEDVGGNPVQLFGKYLGDSNAFPKEIVSGPWLIVLLPADFSLSLSSANYTSECVCLNEEHITPIYTLSST